ncbi:Transmembrane protein [Wickerhamomyces ciferrii]|uniref:Transmembrane protein n=1 Tax=Wickerhamomyces ciferrii (strain ATCC 14091 / BCRC 22168 / CBS 111 / JCM 3599 / NBRC 0793 / NRRL Y-1031 F-60-10) TaxID=1206466 RepID=K0KPD5_WICCF|nr:Transmembrane protein [Wickerhamomyces ciferrii]CCH44811.1 Transmembrane protein [Wickerhamomyces ciferrii]
MPDLNIISLDNYYSIIARGLVLVYIAYRSYSHKSLTNSGILAALITGFIHSLPPSNLYLTLIVTFYLTSSKATKYKENIKSKLTKTPKEKSSLTKSHDQRTHIQVLSNSIVATILLIALVFTTNERYQTLLKTGIIAQYTAVIADTWSSELGILSKSDPFLITTFKTVPPGTNGGVSKVGLLSGILGSALISGVSIFSFENDKISHFIFFTITGLLGTIIDSLLGALLQASIVDNQEGKILEALGGGKITNEYLQNNDKVKIVSGYDLLSNNGVNVLMATITTLLSIGLYSILF